MAGGSVDLEGGEAELTLPEQAHYLGHRDALKPALSVLENLAFWRDVLGGAAFDAAESLAAWIGSRRSPAGSLSVADSGGGFSDPGCSRTAADLAAG